MRYCWKRSVPADKEILFGIEVLRDAVRLCTRSRVSETVVEGVLASARMSDSIAATGIVRSGSSERRRW